MLTINIQRTLIVSLALYTYVTFAYCSKNIRLIGKHKNEAKEFASVNTF